MVLNSEQRKIRLRKAAGYMEMLNCLKENSESKTSQLGTEIGEADFSFITSQMEQKKKKKNLFSAHS